MSVFELDGNALDGVRSFSGFDIDSDIKHLRLIGDASSTHNEVLQSTALPMPTATLSGRTNDLAQINALDALRQSHEAVSFTDPDATRTVVVETFTRTRSVPAEFLFEWQVVLVEVS